MHPDEAFLNLARQHRFPVDETIKVGGQYAPVVLDGGRAYVAGQIPRIGDQVHHVGVVGSDLTLDDARRAAAISTLRALGLVRSAIGTLADVSSVPRITVFVRSAPDFTQQSEVADGASEVLHTVLGSIGTHTRTSVGVLQLPKGAAVEIDFIFGIGSGN